MKERYKAIVKIPLLGRILLILYRAKMVFVYFQRPVLDLLRWLVTSKEITNFTYDLEEHNKCYLASIIADVTEQKYDSIMAYIKEVEQDSELRKHILDSIKKSGLEFMADEDVRFGRRVGWYALTRALKPKIVIETGVDKGLGACVLTAALKKNIEEGYEGTYFGTDINREAGYLLSNNYANYGGILYGDSIESLKNLDVEIDLFINDSDHSAEYEAEEYKTVADMLSPHAVILGDNSHCTNKLLKFSLAMNRDFVFFQEKPKNHWYPGAGIGISFKR